MMKGPEPRARDESGHQQSRRSPPTIGQALQRRRDELALSRDKAAEVIGVSRSTYSAYENDQRRLSPEVLRTLAGYLGSDLEEILDLFGATCVAQARRVLIGVSPAGSLAPTRTGIRRTARSDDMAIVERVYFDGSSRDDARDVVAIAPREEGRVTPPGAVPGDFDAPGVKKKGKKLKKSAKKSKDRKKRQKSKLKFDASKKESKKGKSKKSKSKKRR
jgi:transcriptional regulator with XRE-family HTH domain